MTVSVVWFLFKVPWVNLRGVNMVFSDHTHFSEGLKFCLSYLHPLFVSASSIGSVESVHLHNQEFDYLHRLA